MSAWRLDFHIALKTVNKSDTYTLAGMLRFTMNVDCCAPAFSCAFGYKNLVVYFSVSGVTARAAENLAKAAGADLYEIQPAVPYTLADLDWNDKKFRSSLEMKDEASRPELKSHDAPIAVHDTIFLGFP